MGLVEQFRPTMETVLIFLQYVKYEGTKDQLVIGDKMTGFSYSLWPDNSLIRAEKVVQP